MTFDFKCACGHTFERTFSFKDVVDSTRCPKCGRLAERKYSPLPHKWKDGQKPN